MSIDLTAMVVTHSEGLEKAKKTRDFLEFSCGLEARVFVGTTGRNLKREYPWRFLGKDCQPPPSYYDPHLRRVLTLGEMGCLMSHIMAIEVTKPPFWLGPVLYVEDDIAPGTLFDNLRAVLDEVENTEYDLVYLGQRHHRDTKPSGRFLYEVEEGERPWWTSSYILSASGREKVLNSPFDSMMCAADDYLAAVFGKHSDPWLNARIGAEGEHRVFSTLDRVFTQPTFQGSLTERGPYVNEPSNISAFTFSTDKQHPGYRRLMNSAERFGYHFIDAGRNFDDWDTSKPGGISKLRGMQHHLLANPEINQDTNRLVLFVDGWDVVLNGGVGILETEYRKHYDGKVVAAAEVFCWPPDIKAEDYPDTGDNPFRYLNSGCYMGPASKVYRIIDRANCQPTDDDQGAMARIFLEGKENFVIDSDCRLFQCLNGVLDKVEVDPGTGILRNTITGTKPLVIHGNGNSDAWFDTPEGKTVGFRSSTTYGQLSD